MLTTSNKQNDDEFVVIEQEQLERMIITEDEFLSLLQVTQDDELMAVFLEG